MLQNVELSCLFVGRGRECAELGFRCYANVNSMLLFKYPDLSNPKFKLFMSCLLNSDRDPLLSCRLTNFYFKIIDCSFPN